MLLKEIKRIFHKELEGIYPKEEVNSFFYILIEHYLNIARFILLLDPELNISKREEQPLFEGLSKLKLETPIQYITGETSFMDLTFAVNEHVLIPRPETEELVQWVISQYSDKHGKNSDLKILDIGTGSGCIGVTLAKHFPNAGVYALDFSKKALKIARMNAKRNGVMLGFILADLFEIGELDTIFDIIVSNPPYVRELEKSQMQKNVLEYEPPEALFVRDDAPLVFYEKIAQLAVRNLKNGGTLFLEINQYLGEETKEVLARNGFVELEIKKDFFGNFRMLKGNWTTEIKDVG